MSSEQDSDPKQKESESSQKEAGLEKKEGPFELFQKKLAALSSSEEKLRLAIDFMREALSQDKTPHFKDFWEARRLCLPLFKEDLNPLVRSKLWAEYIELTAEGRKLKVILDEQTAFAVEQIELAINAMNKDLDQYAEMLEQISPIELAKEAKSIREKAETYSGYQRELNLLNTLASRLNALRKEIIKTEMRIRQKNQFFKMLSTAGDRIFPRRKELIKNLSQEFQADVQAFVAKHFKEEEVVGAPYYQLREEIKALQGVAKQLTINTQVFTQTRMLLSECWDRIKNLEKEYRKESAHKKQSLKDNRNLVEEKIAALSKKAVDGEINAQQLHAEVEEISKFMRSVELFRDDVRDLKKLLSKAQDPILEKERYNKKQQKLAQQEAEKKRREEIEEIKKRIANLTDEVEEVELENLNEAYEQLLIDLKDLAISKVERQIIEKSLRPLKDAITDKRENALLNLSEDEKQSLDKLKEVLQQRKERRKEIKIQLESLRKTLGGGSSFAFEKAMMYREMIDMEKERLEKADEGITDIETKITELESR